MNLPDLPPASPRAAFLVSKRRCRNYWLLPTEASSFATARWRLAGSQDIDMPTPIPFDGGSPACRANLQTWRANPAPRFPIWRFLLAVAALPPLLAFLAAASWLAWMCFQGVMGTLGALMALAGIAALAALIRRHTGMALGAALTFVALVGLAGLGWAGL
jgi:hypothetical protein